MDQALVDRVRDAIKTSHDVGNDWDIMARAAISEVEQHLASAKLPLDSRVRSALREAGEQARRDFEENTR